MTHNNLVLSLNVREIEVLPRVASVGDLVASNGSCWTELLPEFTGPASAICSFGIGPAGGPLCPNGWTSDPIVSMRAVNLFKIQGAYYFPEYGVIIDRHGRAMRSAMAQVTFITPDLLLLPGIQKTDGGTVFSPPADIETLPEAVITMHWGASRNYGHFVADCLTGVALLQNTPEFRDGPYVFPMLSRWQREYLHLLAVTPVELHTPVLYLESAIFTSCMDTHLQAPNVSYRLLSSLIRTAVDRISAPVPLQNRRIYLSRRGQDKRLFVSEIEFESALRDRGFEIIQPETLPIAEQVSLFASSAVIVGPFGSAFANVLFCSPNTVVVEIRPEWMPANLVRYACLLTGCRWAPYFCRNGPKTQTVIIGGKERPELGVSFDLDLNDFLRHLDAVIALSPANAT